MSGHALNYGFRGLAAAARRMPWLDPLKQGIDITRDIPYLPDARSEHRLDLYRRADLTNTKSLPVVLYVHGGGFRILDKETHWLMATLFARAGYLVASINYRLAPQHRFPAAIEDTCDAFVWVARHIASHGGDPSSIVLAGESAGANLITATALACCYQRSEPFARRVWDTQIVPRAVMPACGMLQVSQPERFRIKHPKLSPWLYQRILEVSEGYLGAGPLQPRTVHDLADPLCTFERGIPTDRPLPAFFIPCGTRDPLLSDSARLAAALKILGARCEYKKYSGGLHAFHAFAWQKLAKQCWADQFAFLDEVLT